MQGCILLPRAALPLNVFEPRYLAMIKDVLAGERIIGIVQPASPSAPESPAGKTVRLRQVGCAGRLTAFSETENGRVLITLTGISRFVIETETPSAHPYRICAVSYGRFATDFIRDHGHDTVDIKRFLGVLRAYLSAQDLVADWGTLRRSPAELLINTLSLISPFGPNEKQALLEAADLRARAEVLMALAEMDIASPDDSAGGVMQ